MKSASEFITFTVPLSSEFHAKAEQFRLQHKNPQKAKQVYLNTLAVSAVNFYLRCMGIATNWEASDSSNPIIQTLMDVADLEIIGLGKIECRPILPQENVIHIPPEASCERVGYLAVQLDESLSKATLLGFSKTVTESCEIPINKLRSLAEMLVQLQQATEIIKQPIHLSQWFQNIIDVGWQNVDLLLHPQQQTALAFRSGTGKHNIEYNSDNPIFSVEQGKLISLGQKSDNEQVALLVELIHESEKEIDIWVKACPIGREKYLPEELQLMVLDESGTAVIQAIARSTENMQINFSSSLGERFSIKLVYRDVKFTEDFVV